MRRGAVWALALFAVAASSADEPTFPVKDALQAALADPLNGDKVRRLATMLPHDGQAVVVEGDIVLSTDEFQAYVAATSQRAMTPPGKSHYLFVGRYHGVPDVWPSGSRTLRYAVAKHGLTDAQYELIRTNFRDAAHAWSRACPECGVSFVEVQRKEDTPTPGKALTFVIQLHDTGGSYLLSPFFPHTEQGKRFVNIDPSFFRLKRSVNKTHLFTHAIGHILGYQHSFADGVPTCLSQGSKLVSPEHKQIESVMASYCPGDHEIETWLRHADKRSHRQLYNYDLNDPFGPTSGGRVVVRFSTGTKSERIQEVIGMLDDFEVVPTKEHTLGADETLCDFWTKQQVTAKACDDKTMQVAAKLNGFEDAKDWHPKPGEVVRYPSLALEDYVSRIRVNSSDADKIHQLQSDPGKLSEQPTADGMEEFLIKGKQVKFDVPDVTKADSLLRALRSSADLSVTFEPSTKSPPKTFAIPPDDFAAHCVGQSLGQSFNGQQCETGFASYFGTTPLPATGACTDQNHPEVILVDTDLDRHWDLPDNIDGMPTAPAQAAQPTSYQILTQQQARTTQFHHATHMSGIIASRANGKGLLGLDPLAVLGYFAWSESAVSEFDTYTNTVAPNQDNYFFVFASEYSYPPDTTGTRIRRPIGISAGTDLRLLGSIANAGIMAKDIVGSGKLWIVAAGQATGGDDGVEITTQTPFGPMNLGDQPNVLVVTACEACETAQPTLLQGANWSRTLVHIAAPGRSVLSSANSTAYARADGTSPATAFVAGIASAIQCANHNYFSSASAAKMKRWLQVTSRPVFINDLGDHLAAGILDPQLAFLNPRKTWMKTSVDARPQAIDGLHWSQCRLTLLRAGGAEGELGTVALRDVYRITRYEGQLAEAGWMMYRRASNGVDGSVERIGPFKLGPADMNHPLLTSAANPGGVQLSMLDELLIQQAGPPPACAQ